MRWDDPIGLYSSLVCSLPPQFAIHASDGQDIFEVATPQRETPLVDARNKLGAFI